MLLARHKRSAEKFLALCKSCCPKKPACRSVCWLVSLKCESDESERLIRLALCKINIAKTCLGPCVCAASPFVSSMLHHHLNDASASRLLYFTLALLAPLNCSPESTATHLNSFKNCKQTSTFYYQYIQCSAPTANHNCCRAFSLKPRNLGGGGGLNSQLLKFSHHCDDHIFISFVFPQFTSFHSMFNSFHWLR